MRKRKDFGAGGRRAKDGWDLRGAQTDGGQKSSLNEDFASAWYNNQFCSFTRSDHDSMHDKKNK